MLRILLQNIHTIEIVLVSPNRIEKEGVSCTRRVIWMFR
jgi:hypothetical protein